MPGVVTSEPLNAGQRPSKVVQEGLRLDGRGFEEFRPVFFSIGSNNHSQASGAAYAEFNKTKVMASVYGPRPSDRKTSFSEQGRLQCDVKFTSFGTAQRGKSFAQTPEERDISSVVQASLEAAVQTQTFPKANVDVFCLVIESGGSDTAVAITAASLALADAGIEMYDLVTACKVSRVGGELLLDPTADESYHEDGGVVMAMMPNANLVTQFVLTGTWSDGQYKDVLELCMGGCAQLDAVARQYLQQSLAPA